MLQWREVEVEVEVRRGFPHICSLSEVQGVFLWGWGGGEGGRGKGEGGRGKGEGGGEVVMKWCNGEWWSGGGCPEICMWKFNASITFHDN